MAQIGEVYGTNYTEQSKIERMKYAVKLISSNIANKNLTFRHDSSEMWNGSNMRKEAIKMLMEQVQRLNPKFKMTYVDKTTTKVNMFPYLINGPVEYFVVTDLSEDQIKLYQVYVSPTLMEAF